MSRQSKNARNLAAARQFSEQRKKGNKGPSSTGPSSTGPKHQKRWGYRTNPDVQKRIAEQLKATASPADNRTAGKKILETAGGASREA